MTAATDMPPTLSVTSPSRLAKVHRLREVIVQRRLTRFEVVPNVDGELALDIERASAASELASLIVTAW